MSSASAPASKKIAPASPPPVVADVATSYGTVQNEVQQVTSQTQVVSGCVSSVADAQAGLAQAQTALAADIQRYGNDPTSDAGKAALAADYQGIQAAQNKLNTASASLDAATNQLNTDINNLDQARTAASTQTSAQNDRKLQQNQQVQNDAVAQQAVDNASIVLKTAQKAKSGVINLGAGSPQDSLTMNSGAAPQESVANATDFADVDPTDAATAKSTTGTGSRFDAGAMLSDNGIDGFSWAKENAKQFKEAAGESAFNAMMDVLGTKTADQAGGSSSDQTTTGKGGTKATSPKLGAGAPATTDSTKLFSANLGAGVAAADPTATTASTPGLTAIEVMMLVMLQATQEVNHGMEVEATSLQNITTKKQDLDTQLEGLNDQTQAASSTASASSTQTTANTALQAKISNVQTQLDSLGSDTQMMQLHMQSMLQVQQQLMQGVSNMSKSINDTSMAELRHIGS